MDACSGRSGPDRSSRPRKPAQLLADSAQFTTEAGHKLRAGSHLDNLASARSRHADALGRRVSAEGPKLDLDYIAHRGPNERRRLDAERAELGPSQSKRHDLLG